MTYRLKNRNNLKSRFGKFGFVALVFIFFIVVVNFFMPNFLSGTLNVVLYPALLIKDSGFDFFYNFPGYFKSNINLENELQALRDENSILKLSIQDIKTLQDENDKIKNLTSSYSKLNYKVASVIKWPDYFGYANIMISLGNNSDIKVGDMVLGENNNVLGSISEIYSYASKVALLSSSGNQIQAILATTTTVMITGNGNGNFLANIPNGVKVAVGDSVTIPGNHRYLIGTVQDIEPDTTQSFKKLIIKSGVNIFQTNWVIIIPNGQ